MKTSSNSRSKRRRGNPTKTLGKGPTRRKRRGRQFLRFDQVKGKTVEFVEMGTAADFPCIEIGFADKTALHFTMDTRLTMEPVYSDWKTGDQRLLRTWPAIDCR
jgi:hypothetical protein